MRLIGLAVVLAVSLYATPPNAEAQQARARLVMLLTGSPAVSGPEYAAFNKTLGELGWVEGQTLVIDRRWADTAEKFVTLAADAVLRSLP
jgi:hypothetical protein